MFCLPCLIRKRKLAVSLRELLTEGGEAEVRRDGGPRVAHGDLGPVRMDGSDGRGCRTLQAERGRGGAADSSGKMHCGRPWAPVKAHLDENGGRR